MRLFKYRVSADDPKIHDSGARWRALRAQNYSQRVLLSGLPLHLEQPGRAHNRTALASVLSRERIWHGSLVGEADFIDRRIDSSHPMLLVMNSLSPSYLFGQSDSRISPGVATARCEP
jgi:hypothetical protein